jgi:CRP-like cAMP-binding protein
MLQVPVNALSRVTGPFMAENRLLSFLSSFDRELLKPHLEPVDLKFRQRLQTSNRRIGHAYFPESGLGSVVAIGSRDRRQAEVAVVGREGMTGIPVVLGADRGPCEVFMQVEGAGQRIAAEALQSALEESTTLRRCLLRFVHAFQMQAHYTALANAQGTIQQRLARWLLMAQDRMGKDTLELTHEFMSLMLGTRRAGVTTAIGDFESKGLVEGARGAVTILDRDGLEDCANGLYGVPEAEYERLFKTRLPSVTDARA